MFSGVSLDLSSVRGLPSKVDMVMFSEIIKSLQLKTVLTNKNVLDLRWFISNKFPQLTSQEAGKLFADSVNRVIDKNIPLLDDSIRSKVKTLLFEGAIKKSVFKISFYDVLKICIQIKIDNYKFFEELANWTQTNTGKQVSVDSISNFIKKVHMEMQYTPTKNINEIISAITESGYVNKEPSVSYAQQEEIEDSVYDTDAKTVDMPEIEQSSSTINSVSSYQDDESISTSSKNLELTHVSYDEYKPIYSFGKSSTTNYFNRNDENVKKKFSTFIKKVTMRKFLTL